MLENLSPNLAGDSDVFPFPGGDFLTGCAVRRKLKKPCETMRILGVVPYVHAYICGFLMGQIWGEKNNIIGEHEKDNASASKNALGRRIRLLTTVKMTIDYAAFCTVLLETYHGKGTSTYWKYMGHTCDYLEIVMRMNFTAPPLTVATVFSGHLEMVEGAHGPITMTPWRKRNFSWSWRCKDS